MLKKLRRRFVAISMSIICSLLAFFFLVAGLLFIGTMVIDMRTVLQSYSDGDFFPGGFEIGGKKDSDAFLTPHSGGICVVEVKAFGSAVVLDFSRADMDEAILSRAVNYVIESGEDFGFINELNLCYNKSVFASGYRIAFADSTQFSYYMKAILIDGGIVFLFSVVLLGFFLHFLAKMCLKPVEKAWEQQKNFIADASHELKTPLTVILTNTGILKSHKFDTVDNQLKWVDSTYEEATHMKDLVEKLLLLAKTDNMSRKNLFTDIDFSELAMKLALQYEPVAFEKGVLLDTDIEKDIWIYGDSIALNQIVLILLDNAVKYSDVGGKVEMTLKKRYLYPLKKGGGYIYLTMRNTGTPISQEDIPHLFERFYRSDKARTSGNGYGLGLSICKNLAILHNADISVSSDEKNGTVFTVRFRMKKKK